MSAKILALDTSTENCSVALMVNDQLYTRSEIAPRDHTKKILPMVDEVLKEADVSLQDLDALAFGRGPGSFTGVRIGIGIAQGLSFGAELPMIGISTLAAMAQASYRVHKSKQVVAAIDARMSEIYWGQYQREADGQWRAIAIDNGQAECVIPPSELSSHLTVTDGCWTQAGTGWAAYEDALNSLPLTLSQGDVFYPEAQDIAFLAQFEWSKGNTVDAEQASPTYLRDKVTWKKLPGRE
ncbi:tRNA (adenosine(37)-N6)-threonylcarbamoyltransferase complex dimerization subunit type 1 TsaB [Vibrio sp. S17_S38]|uniref:tRNA (adenosine(37)-N6)-threonylcarbamoyltransferase complex dimerization subunit type 1 TsaB n=1 Tax=Vibrio sp. S17_S38 TaxID=2720229 RepID=UPI001680C324|nr:tRNA (adenosine(37)-N6)-threonylcarbamoyltransferase complex dimerization subunit type 1 TsaB [Vibrio sp. S17_S38]MBD1571825.1 tRNA (adenosine(37)-N6)-threonylcarbamoyltransferase complex dimerization subunit type 1 TsaB [Vibrio sp. S17_S38]